MIMYQKDSLKTNRLLAKLGTGALAEAITYDGF